MGPIKDFLRSTTGLVVAGVVLVAVALLAYWLVVAQPRRAKEAAARAHAGEVISGGNQNAASAATGEVAGLGERNEQRARNEQDAISDLRSQPGYSAPADSGVFDSTLRGLCKQPGYRDERCAQVR